MCLQHHSQSSSRCQRCRSADHRTVHTTDTAITSATASQPAFAPTVFRLSLRCNCNLSLSGVAPCNHWLLIMVVWLSSVLRPHQPSICYMGDGFTGQKTQPTVSKYWRKIYKGKQPRQHQENTKYKYAYTYKIVDE